MILAYRMEGVLTKQQIRELYLNQIFLGRNAYGVQAAARAYFDKDVADLKLHEMAYLAILPKGPANYRPESPTGHERALERRNWALGEMYKNRSEEHTSELQSLMRISYAVFCLKKKKKLDEKSKQQVTTRKKK